MKKSSVLALILFFMLVFIFTSCETGESTVSDASSGTYESGGVSVSNPSGSDSQDVRSESSEFNESSDSSDSKPESSQTSESKPTGGTSSGSNSTSQGSTSNVSSNPGDNSEPESPKYLSVIDCVLTDNNCFVVVGKCEEGASVTAVTDAQSVTVSSDKGYYSVRLRKLSTKTKVKLEAKGKFTEKYTFEAAPKVPSPDMWPIVGADGYNFFFKSMMPDFMQTNRLPDSRVDYLTQKTRDRIDYLQQMLPDTEIIYMIVPSKASIYPERVPSDYPKGTGKSKLEQVNEALAAGGAKVINLLDVFKKHKNDAYKLYWNTDSHWTDYGAFVAYTELFNYISTSFPEAAPRKQQEFDFKCDFFKSGDMMMYMMINQNNAWEYNCLRVPKFSMNSSITAVPRYRAQNDLVYNDQVTYARTIYNDKDSLPNLYVIRDSYCAQIYDILAERSNTTYYKPMWNYAYDIGDIKRSAPDYIIYLFAEWNIDTVVWN